MPPKKMAVKKTAVPKKATVKESVTSTKYLAKRKNIPPAGLEAHGRVAESQKIRYEYNPHLPPVLRSAKTATEADRLPELLAISTAAARFRRTRRSCSLTRCDDMSRGWSGAVSEKSLGSRSSRWRCTCTSASPRRRFCACSRGRMSSATSLPIRSRNTRRLSSFTSTTWTGRTA